MRLVRYLDDTGAVSFGARLGDGSVRAIDGDPIHGTYAVSVRPARIARLLAPLIPTNILGIGLNYRKHAEEGGKGVPERPMLFIKSTNTVQDPGGPILLPGTLPCTEVDYEGELAIVIGKPARNVPKERALDYVLGCTIANDVSARDWQFKWGGGQFCQGKSFDTFCPLGPEIVTLDELGDPNNLRLRTLVNGEVRQDWTTADMVFDVATLISFLSSDKTLLPGTVLLTGTPHGVGYARKPPTFLKAGDSVSIEIERLGTLTNPVAAA